MIERRGDKNWDHKHLNRKERDFQEERLDFLRWVMIWYWMMVKNWNID